MKAGFIVNAFEQSPTLYYAEEEDGLLELHVDGGHGTVKPEVARRVFLHMETHRVDVSELVIRLVEEQARLRGWHGPQDT